MSESSRYYDLLHEEAGEKSLEDLLADLGLTLDQAVALHGLDPIDALREAWIDDTWANRHADGWGFEDELRGVHLEDT